MTVRFIILSCTLVLLQYLAKSQSPVIRKDLLTKSIHPFAVVKVEIKSITMSAGQSAPLHRHPCPVFGYVTKGKLFYQVKGEPQQILQQGDAFYEPADQAIAHFDNASPTEELTFVAFYLKDGGTGLIEMLPVDK